MNKSTDFYETWYEPLAFICDSTFNVCNFLHSISTRSLDSSVDIVNGLQAGRPRNRDSIAGKSKRFSFSTIQLSDPLWDPPSLLSSVYRGLFPRGKASGEWSCHLSVYNTEVRYAWSYNFATSYIFSVWWLTK